MGDLIVLAERRVDRPRAGERQDVRPTFFFDLACPFSYLAAERVERILGDVEWMPAASAALPGGGGQDGKAPLRVKAERRAAELRLPLVWPEGFPADSLSALRAASYAAEIQAGARFALAASRLAFCGGFDLQDPEILAEAAAAAGVPVDACLAAAGDTARDSTLHATARGLRAQGVRSLPAVRAGRRWFQGERAPVEAAALLGDRGMYGSPLAG